MKLGMAHSIGKVVCEEEKERVRVCTCDCMCWCGREKPEKESERETEGEIGGMCQLAQCCRVLNCVAVCCSERERDRERE